MSPAIARTSNADIVSAARALLETGGLDAVTMQAVADRVGIRAPSLYKRFADRAAVLTAVADDVAADLARAVAPALTARDPAAATAGVARRYRRFAHASPNAYRLLFATTDTGPTPAVNAASASGLLELMTRLVGTRRALDAARLLTAFVHGFVSMELAGAFRLGGDVDEAFDFGLERIIGSLAETSTSA